MSGMITALEVQQRNKERVSVYLDGEFAFGVTLLEAARLRRGQTLSDAEIAELRARDAVEQGVDQAVRFLSYRPRSAGEIRRYLAQKRAEPPVIEQVLDRLIGLGYVDDLAFARYWVENREEFRPKGPLALRQELREKGISKALIDQALSDVDFTESAYRAVQPRLAAWGALDRRALKQKVYEYLARRGFGAETIRDVIDRVQEETEMPGLDRFDDEIL